MKSSLVLMGFLIYCAAGAQGDKTGVHLMKQKEAVVKPIKLLLEALQKGDSALLHQAFTHDVTMAIFGTDKDGKASARYESSLDGLLKRVGTPHPEVDNEVIWDEKILVEGNLAQVWANYAFTAG